MSYILSYSLFSSFFLSVNLDAVEESADTPKNIGQVVIRGDSISQFELVGLK